jgi:hypothetical protein
MGEMQNLFSKKIHQGGSFFIFNFVFTILSLIVLIYLVYLVFAGGRGEGIQCVYKVNLGYECQTCGFTRCFIDYLKFDFSSGYGRNKASLYYFVFANYFAFSRFFWVIYLLRLNTRKLSSFVVTMDVYVLVLAFISINILIYLV